MLPCLASMLCGKRTQKWSLGGLYPHDRDATADVEEMFSASTHDPPALMQADGHQLTRFMNYILHACTVCILQCCTSKGLAFFIHFDHPAFNLISAVCKAQFNLLSTLHSYLYKVILALVQSDLFLVLKSKSYNAKIPSPANNH